MKQFPVVVCLLSLLVAVVGKAEVTDQMKARRAQVDQLLKLQKTFEAADGYLRENPGANAALTTAERQAITDENADRSALFDLVSKSDPAVADAATAGEQFASKHLSRYIVGILRQDPSTSEIFDRWPPERKDAATMLGEFFIDVDQQESELRRAAATAP